MCDVPDAESSGTGGVEVGIAEPCSVEMAPREADGTNSVGPADAPTPTASREAEGTKNERVADARDASAPMAPLPCSDAPQATLEGTARMLAPPFATSGFGALLRVCCATLPSVTATGSRWPDLTTSSAPALGTSDAAAAGCHPAIMRTAVGWRAL